MSDHETEQADAAPETEQDGEAIDALNETPDEPDADPSTETDAEPIEGDESGDDDGGEQGDGESVAPDAERNEKAIEKLHAQLAKANTAHVAKVSRIMGDDATSLIPCPVCMDFVAGLIFPPEVAPLPENVRDRMRQLIGLDSWEDIPSVTWAQQCSDCKGHGEVKTGSSVQGKETTRCETCQGDGWQNLRKPEGVAVLSTVPPTETGPTIYGTEVSNDPDVQYLRDKGYTVIPPMRAAQ